MGTFESLFSMLLISSRVAFLQTVSFTHQNVRNIAMNEMPLHDIKTAPAPNFDADVANTMVPNNAPAFPHADETPFNVARQGLVSQRERERKRESSQGIP